MERRTAAAPPLFDVAWLRVLVTIVLAVLAAALTVFASPEPAEGSEGGCRSAKPGVRAALGGSCARALGMWRVADSR